jgi:hypothetical protein
MICVNVVLEAFCENAYPNLVRGMITMSDFDDYIAAGNPKTTANSLRSLSVAAKTIIRQRLAENPNSPHELIEKLAKDAKPEVRAFIATNRCTPFELLEDLSKDADDDVRLSLAEDPNIPMSIVLRLSADENPYVRDAAVRTLDRISLAQILEGEAENVTQEINEAFAQMLIDARLIESTLLNEYLKTLQESPVHIARVLLEERTLDLPTIAKALKLQKQVQRGKVSYESALDELGSKPALS